jgi:hypothetical protein
MITSSLHDSILKALAGSSSQAPVDRSKLLSLMVPKVKLDELTAALDAMFESHEIQTCSGIKGGKAYVCYWITGIVLPAWGKPSKTAAEVKKPAAESKRKT